jgi:molecular chaperone HscA
LTLALETARRERERFETRIDPRVIMPRWIEAAAKGDDGKRVALLIEDLDHASKDFAGRRMNRAIAQAIAGQKIESVEKTVEKAKGIEAAHGSPLPPEPASR